MLVVLSVMDGQLIQHCGWKTNVGFRQKKCKAPLSYIVSTDWNAKSKSTCSLNFEKNNSLNKNMFINLRTKWGKYCFYTIIFFFIP